MSVRIVVRSFSELCITAGTLIVLFVVYLLYWTGVKADHAASDQMAGLQQQWAQSPPPRPAPRQGPAASAGPPAPAAYGEGRPFAVMYIPRLGKEWHKPVIEGTAVKDLQKGLGHYANTTALGQPGNFSVAGHRRTYGDPFKDFPELRPGDAVVLRDDTTWYTYRIDNKPYRTVPSDVGVIDAVPAESPFRSPGRYLTLTTCDPEWGSSHRLIAWGHLDATQPVTRGKPPALDG
ncbi:class E sortase [Streptomyces sp. NBC_00083]|uniref:class E sortase n=1 Tax=Streptomyces sp. NBC_00083 TaxID=2975647 RepID=UPI002257EBEE|nr:class E sortase [Streptomyces sp. NBC_00083]MCX5388354.1 class E sortase [Streptomyces sp. NBC_00083]